MSKVRQLVIGIADFIEVKEIKAVKAVAAVPAKNGKPAKPAIKEVKGRKAYTGFLFTHSQNHILAEGTTFKGKKLKYVVVEVDEKDQRETLFAAKCTSSASAKDIKFDLNGGATL